MANVHRKFTHWEMLQHRSRLTPSFHLSLKERRDDGQEKQPVVQSAEEGQKSLVVPPRKNKRSPKKNQDPLRREQSTEEPSTVDQEFTESVQVQVEVKQPVHTDGSDVVEPAAEVSQEKSTPVPCRRKSRTSAPVSSVDDPSDSVEKGPSLVQEDQKAAQGGEGSVTKLVPTRRKSKTVGPTTGLQDPGTVDGKREADVPNDSDQRLSPTDSESKGLEISPELPNRLVEESIGVTEGPVEQSGAPAPNAPATPSESESVSQLVLSADERPEETTGDQSETVAAAAEGSRSLPPRRKSKAAETPLKEKEKAKLSPAPRKTKTPTKSPVLAAKGAKDVSRNPERQKSVEDTEAAVSKETKLIPTKRKTKGVNGGTAELESKNSQESEGGAASVSEQKGTTAETSIVKESALLATTRKSKSPKVSPELSSKKDKEAVKKSAKPPKPIETSAVEDAKASPSNKRAKPSPETRKSSEKSKTTEGEKGVIPPPKRKLSVKPSSDAPATEPAKSKDSPGSRKADPTKTKVKTAGENSAAEKGKVSPAVRKSKGLKTLPATKRDSSQDQDSSLTAEVATTAKVEAETDGIPAANSESEHLQGSSEVSATETEPDEPAAASPSVVQDDPAKVQPAEDAVIEEPEVRAAREEQSHVDVTTDTQGSEGLKSVEPAGTDQMPAGKEQDKLKPPSTSQSTDIMTPGSSTDVLAEEHELPQDKKLSLAESDLLPDVPVEEEAEPDSRSEGQEPSANLLSKVPENPTEDLDGQDQSPIPEVIAVAADLNKEEDEVPPVDLSSNDQSPEVTLEKTSPMEEELPKTEEHPSEETAKPTPRQSDGFETSVEPPAMQLPKAEEEAVGETSQQVVTSEVAEENKASLWSNETLETECAVEKVTPITDEVSLPEANAEETAPVGVPTTCETKEREHKAEDLPERDATQSVIESEMTQPQSRPSAEPSQSLADYIDTVCDVAEPLPKRYLVLDVAEMGFDQTYQIKSAPQEEKTVAQVDSSRIFSSSPDRGSEPVRPGVGCEVDVVEKQERAQNVAESYDLQGAETEIRIVQLDVEITSAQNVDLAPPSFETERAPVDKYASAAEEKSEKDKPNVTRVEENQDPALEQEKMLMVEISSSTQAETQVKDSEEENPALIITVTQGQEPLRDAVTAGDTVEKTILVVQDTSSGLSPHVPELVGPAGAASQPHVGENELIEINIYEQDSKPPETTKMLKVEGVTATLQCDVAESDLAQSEGPQPGGEEGNLPTGEQPQVVEEQMVAAPELPDVPVLEPSVQSEASVCSVQMQSGGTASTESLEEQQESATAKEQRETVVCLESQQLELEAAETSQKMKSPRVRLHLVRLHWQASYTASSQ